MSRFSIVIPAYNEEKAISAIIERCLDEKERIQRELRFDSLEIIVVNDGSQDRTAEIAANYEGVIIVTHPHNRGYGAALKSGFAKASGDILGFLDADGTCDPLYFVELCKYLYAKNADIVIGTRMNQKSQMPQVRRLGNKFFAALLSILSNVKVTDIASGMRVLRRDSLAELYPLPDGLHFTPAMSAKALLSKHLSIYEVPIPYAERRGRSKLSIFTDGFRFIKTIMAVALTYKPRKLFGAVGAFFLVIALLYSIYPIMYYIRYARLEELMIYRLLSVLIFTVVGFNSITIGEITESFLILIKRSNKERSFSGLILSRLFSGSSLAGIGIILLILGPLLNYKTIYQYITTQHIYVHWSYLVLGGMLILVGLQLIGLAVLKKFLELAVHELKKSR